MLETCRCGEQKIRTEVDGRFVYQICEACGDIISLVYLRTQQTIDETINSEMLGI
jgi:hypothetical protein